MADVPGKFYRATKVRTGVAPSSAGSIEGEVLPPVNPPGSSLNSVGITMPSAFTVSNSPLTANGTIGVAGAGTVAQYIRGDGSLADFPESSGGGSSVSYYLNGSVDQGTIGGIAYKELSKVPILGAGTDFTINADGYIASFITDAGDPSLLEIPGGNWNFETYFSASSSGGTPTFYVELYKVSGTTATLIASSSSAPELIAFGTNLTPYFSTLAVPTTTLALTDRLAVRYYVTHSGRTITLHTENNHLCQIITTFTTGLTALNGLTAQVQNFAVGTTGTDFNIASATATHTFNLPTASATNRGALSSADWSLFTQAYNDKINSAAVTGTTTKTLTLTQQDGGTITASWSDLNTDAVLSVFGRTGAVVAANGDYTTAQVTESGNLYYTEARVNANANVAANTAARHNAVTLGTANGLSLSTQVLSLGLASAGVTGALSGSDWSTFNSKQNALTLTTTGTSGAATLVGSTLNIPNYGSALAGYLPLIGGTLTGPLNGTSASFTGAITSGTKFISTAGNNNIVFESLSATTGFQYLQLLNNTAHTIFGIEGTAAGSLLTGGTANASVFTSVGNTNLEFGTNQVKRLTIAASTGASTFSSSVTAAGVGTFGRDATTVLGYFGDPNTVGNKYISFSRATAKTDIVNIQGIDAGVGGANIALQALGGNVLIGTTSDASQKLQITGNLLNTVGNNVLVHRVTGATTGFIYGYWTNTSGQLLYGVEGATAAQLQTGSSAYDAVITTASTSGLSIGVNQLQAIKIVNGGAVTFSASVSTPHTTKSANYTLTAADFTVGFDCASNRTANLPDATTCAGRIYVIYQYNTGAGARSVTLDGNGSQTINGMSTYSLSPFCDLTSVMIQSNGSNWIIIASNFTVDCM